MGGILYRLLGVLGLTCGVTCGTWLMCAPPCGAAELLTTRVGGVLPTVDKLFFVPCGGNILVLFLPALVIPVCDVQLELLGAICN